MRAYMFVTINTLSTKVGIPKFVSGPREYIMEGEYVIFISYVFMVPY